MATATMPQPPPLAADARADVCVVGAGIAGLTTAYRLARRGRSVIVLDRGRLAGGQTAKTTAHLSWALDDRFAELETIHGREACRLACESHAAAIDAIESTARDEGIDCDFRRVDGYLFRAPGQPADVLERELEACRRAGLSDVAFVPRAPLPFDTGRCLRFPRQGQFHPLKYLAGLARRIAALGGRLHAGTLVEGVEGGDRVRVATAGGPTVSAGAVVVATNSPINQRYAIHTKQAPYATYALSAPVPRDALTWALYWDALEVYHYVRAQPRADQRVDLIVGGEDHKLGQADDHRERHQRLEAWARARFPMMGPVEHRWSGMVMETLDGLGFIGRDPLEAPNVYLATGDSGMGITHGTIAGLLLSELIEGRDHPWAALYDPARKPMRGGAWRQFAAENLNVVGQLAGDWLSAGDASPEEIPPGQGALVRRGMRKLAVYREEGGRVRAFSAVCPHLGCIVHWNDAETTWDCPCHGSRFAATGEPLNGPAAVGLEPAALDTADATAGRRS